MLNSERQSLNSTMAHEPASALGAVLKCGVCLALMTLLVVIGSTPGNEDAGNGARNRAPDSKFAAKASAAAAHRKEVFDARRAHFADRASGGDAAGMPPVTRAEAVLR